MPKFSPTELRARRLFAHVMQAAITNDALNKPATKDETLLAMIAELSADMKVALHAGATKNKKDQFDPQHVVNLAARIASHAYAIARNNGVINDIDLPEVAQRVPL